MDSESIRNIVTLVSDLFCRDEFLSLLGQISPESRANIADIVPARVVEDGIHALRRRGLLDDFFFANLLELRPARSDEISRTRNNWMSSNSDYSAGRQESTTLTRTFWRPFLRGRTTITIGTHSDDHLLRFEASSLVGLGCALAMAEVIRLLRTLTGQDVEVLPSNNLPTPRRSDNLVLLGGPDVNSLTREFMRLVDSPLQFGDADIHEVSLYDRRDEFGLFNPGRDAAGRIERDHGLALRFPNPYNPLSTVAILAGCFGHGTHAAAQLVCHHGQAIVAPADCAEDGFGLLLQTSVIDNWPLSPKILRSSRVSDRARRG